MGGLLLIGVGIMIASAFCPMFFWKPVVDEAAVEDMQTKIRDRLIEEKAGDDTTDSPKSSNA